MTPTIHFILSVFLLVGIDIVHGFTTPVTTATPSTLLQAKRNSNDDVVVAPTSQLSSNNPLQQLSRRQIGELSFAAVGLTTSFLGTRENTPQEYGLWGVLPVGPYKRKKTIMETIVPDTIWTFDQKVGYVD